MSFCSLPSPPQLPWQPNADQLLKSPQRTPPPNKLARKMRKQVIKKRRWFKLPTFFPGGHMEVPTLFNNVDAPVGARNYFVRERVRTPQNQRKIIKELGSSKWAFGREGKLKKPVTPLTDEQQLRLELWNHRHHCVNRDKFFRGSIWDCDFTGDHSKSPSPTMVRKSLTNGELAIEDIGGPDDTGHRARKASDTGDPNAIGGAGSASDAENVSENTKKKLQTTATTGTSGFSFPHSAQTTGTMQTMNTTTTTMNTTAGGNGKKGKKVKSSGETPNHTTKEGTKTSSFGVKKLEGKKPEPEKLPNVQMTVSEETAKGLSWYRSGGILGQTKLSEAQKESEKNKSLSRIQNMVDSLHISFLAEKPWRPPHDLGPTRFLKKKKKKKSDKRMMTFNHTMHNTINTMQNGQQSMTFSEGMNAMQKHGTFDTLTSANNTTRQSDILGQPSGISIPTVPVGRTAGTIPNLPGGASVLGVDNKGAISGNKSGDENMEQQTRPPPGEGPDGMILNKQMSSMGAKKQMSSMGVNKQMSRIGGGVGTQLSVAGHMDPNATATTAMSSTTVGFGGSTAVGFGTSSAAASTTVGFGHSISQYPSAYNTATAGFSNSSMVPFGSTMGSQMTAGTMTNSAMGTMMNSAMRMTNNSTSGGITMVNNMPPNWHTRRKGEHIPKFEATLKKKMIDPAEQKKVNRDRHYEGYAKSHYRKSNFWQPNHHVTLVNEVTPVGERDYFDRCVPQRSWYVPKVKEVFPGDKVITGIMGVPVDLCV